MPPSTHASSGASSPSTKPVDHTDAHILPEVESTPNDLEKAAEEPAPVAVSPMHPSQFPDGGLEAWLVIFGCFCTLFVSFGWINCIGTFQNYYQTHQLKDYSPSTVSWISSLMAFMMFFWGPFIGKIYDNYGPRYILLVGSFLHVFGLMMVSLSSQYYQFILAQGICSPLGASLIFYAAVSSASTWFFKKRAFALGIVAGGSSTGGVVFPILVNHLVPKIGFEWTMRTCAFIILGLMIIANLTVKSRIPPTPRKFTLMEFITPFTELPFLLLTCGCFAFFMGMFLPINYLVVYAQKQGMSSGLAGNLIPILNAVSLFGRVLPGFVADRVGRFNVIVVLCFFTAIMVLALWIPARDNATIIVFAAMYGFGSGAFVSMPPSLVAQISDISQIGIRNGTLFAAISVASLIGNPIGGALIDRWNGSFTGLQIFCGVWQIAGALFLLAARWVLAGPKLTTKV